MSERSKSDEGAIFELPESSELGSLGVCHLKRLWSRSVCDRVGRTGGNPFANEWAIDNIIYHGLNIPIEDTIQFLYQRAPSFSEFEKWILERNGGAIAASTVERINNRILAGPSIDDASNQEFGRVLSEDDLGFWDNNGYLIVRQAVSKADCRAAEDAVWEHLEMDPADSDSWYSKSRDHGIMVQLFHHPALEAVRKSDRIRNAFAQLWRTADLWCSTDRVSFNPPERPGHLFSGPRLHWDVSLQLPIPFGLQGLVYLTDTAPEQGAFTCVPGFQNRIENWLGSLPPGSNPREQDLEALGAVPVPGKAGDLVIWHQALPHGSRPNRHDRPRIVQYVTMLPSDPEIRTEWK